MKITKNKSNRGKQLIIKGNSKSPYSSRGLYDRYVIWFSFNEEIYALILADMLMIKNLFTPIKSKGKKLCQISCDKQILQDLYDM